ncbi:MAG: alpha/beta hydrolase [Deltaproteobacteria bacterium]|nr:alpha/beta hydrolase [Deltaproteobacteria bacterium]
MPSEALKTIIDMMRAQPIIQGDDIAAMREGMEQTGAVLPAVEGAVYTEVDAAGVPCEWIEIEGTVPERHLLYLHGGGYVLGSPKSHRNLTGRLAARTRARVLAVDYRLAPEHPHPAAVEDATAAYRWLLGEGAEAARTAIGGDSAGGGLTVATLVALRDAGAPLPAAALCLSPWIDLEGRGESMTARAGQDPIVQKDSLLQMAEAYLAGQDPRTPLAAPLYADLHGLPPILIQVGSAETLLDDATRLGERARAAGVDVTVDAWDEMIHVWQIFGGILPEADEAIDHMADFVAKYTA